MRRTLLLQFSCNALTSDPVFEAENGMIKHGFIFEPGDSLVIEVKFKNTERFQYPYTKESCQANVEVFRVEPEGYSI